MKNVKRIAGYTGYLLLVAFIIAEAGLRTKGVYKTYAERTTGRYVSPVMQPPSNKYGTFKPNSSFLLDHGEFQFQYDLNSLGFREKEISDADSTGRRIFVFGDSFTEGVGAAYEESWPRNLEHFLQADSLPSTVYDFGISGGDPFFNYIALKDLFIKYKPTHVIFSVNGTDLSDVVVRGGFSRFKHNGIRYPAGPWYQHLFRWSHVIRFIVIERMGMDFNFQARDAWPALRTASADSIAMCLKITDQLCSDHDTKFMVMTHPMPNVICGMDTLEHMEVDELRPFLTELSVVHLSLPIASRIMGPDCKTYGWPIDGHFNSLGYEILAEEFYRAVQDQYPDFWSY